MKTLILILISMLCISCSKDNPISPTTCNSNNNTEFYVKTGKLEAMFPDYAYFYWSIFPSITLNLDSCIIQVSVKPPDSLVSYTQDEAWREPRWSIFDSGTIYIYNDNYIDWDYRIVIEYNRR